MDVELVCIGSQEIYGMYILMDVELVCVGSQEINIFFGSRAQTNLCILTKYSFLYMYLQVINSYIYLLIAQGHMKQHPSGTVHIEITFVGEFFK
jgi:hypothetical protein